MQNKRERLIEASSELFHKKGLTNTSLADIAKMADVPIGNVYYYFKTKEELALAVLERRRDEWRKVYIKLDENLSDPREKLIAIVQHFDTMKKLFSAHGSPLGKLVYDGEPPNEKAAEMAISIMQEFLQWSAVQFDDLGYVDQGMRHARDLLVQIEGTSLVARALKQELIFDESIDRVCEWLQNLPNKKVFLGKAGIKRDAA